MKKPIIFLLVLLIGGGLGWYTFTPEIRGGISGIIWFITAIILIVMAVTDGKKYPDGEETHGA